MSDLNLDEMLKLIQRFPLVEWHALFVTQQVMNQITASLAGVEDLHSFCSSKIYVMHSQKQPCWKICSREIANKYLNGEITEEYLIEACKVADFLKFVNEA